MLTGFITRLMFRVNDVRTQSMSTKKQNRRSNFSSRSQRQWQLTSPLIHPHLFIISFCVLPSTMVALLHNVIIAGAVVGLFQTYNIADAFLVPASTRSKWTNSRTRDRSDLPSYCQQKHSLQQPPKYHFASSEPSDEITVDNNDNNSALWIMAGIPLISLILPLLLQAKLISTLVIAKRIYIYVLALSVVVIASQRGSIDDPGLGSRLINLTKEIIPSSSKDFLSMEKASSPSNTQTKESQQDDRFESLQALDTVDTSTQAVSLPLIVGSSLVVSLFFVLLQQSDISSSSSSVGDGQEFLQSLLLSFQSFLPTLTTYSNGLVLALFVRAEILRLPLVLTEVVASLSALTLSLLAFYGPSAFVWPLHNILGICLAVAVARMIQLPRLGPILLAMSLLMVYDVVSVGLQLIDLGSEVIASNANNVASTTTSTVTASSSSTAGASAMGAVAMSKVAAASSWQPGLLEVRLKGVVTDLLGLGDAVFPSLLSIFCLRYDKQDSSSNNNNSNTNYFLWSILGFAMGCLICEGVPGISNTGLPALLFLVPSMVAFVGVPVILQGNLSSFWNFDPAETIPQTINSGE